MILERLLHDVRNKFKEVSLELKPYESIPEVESFLKLRGDKLEEFERAVRGYRLTELTGIVLNSLRQRGFDYTIYGICQRGADYFEITKKVKKSISEFEDELRQAAEQEKQEEFNFDKDYAIPDELTEEQLEEIFGNEEDE